MVHAVASVSVVLAADAVPQAVTTRASVPVRRDGQPTRQLETNLFDAEIARAMRASTFLARCGGRTVRVEFDFHHNTDRPDASEPSVVFRPPNRFEIVAPLPMVEPNRSGSAVPSR
jgi:hypothetical protein